MGHYEIVFVNVIVGPPSIIFVGLQVRYSLTEGELPQVLTKDRSDLR